MSLAAAVGSTGHTEKFRWTAGRSARWRDCRDPNPACAETGTPVTREVGSESPPPVRAFNAESEISAEARKEDAALLKGVADQIPGRTICAFGEACSWPTQSFLIKFKDEFEAYAEAKKTLPADRLSLV